MQPSPPSPAEPAPWRPSRVFALAAAVTLGVRLLVLFRLADTVFFLQDHGDSAYYLRWAERVCRGPWSDGQAFLGLPFYPYLLACLQALHVPFPWGPLLLQALADAATGGVIALALARTGGQRGRWIGLAAALGWAFYTPGQGFAATLMPNTLATLAFTSLLAWCLVRRGQPWSTGAALGAGLAIGAGVMLSANLLFVLLLFALALWQGSPAGRRLAEFLPRAALLAAGLAAGSSPSWVHNYFYAGEPVALSAHSGINFYIGNNPRANGYPNFPPGIRASQEGLLEDSARLAEAAAGRPLRRYEVSAFWSAQAGDFIRENRAAWLRLIVAKIRNYYSSYEYDDISTLRPLRALGVLTWGWAFAGVVLAAAAGLAAGWRRPEARWAATAVLLHTVSVLPAFVTERYRLLAVPALLLTAGFGALGFLEARDRRIAGAAGLIAACLAGWVACSATRPPGVELLADYNTAVRLLNAGLRQEALPLVEAVERSGASNAEVALLLGNFWRDAGEPKRAMRHYRDAIQRDPGLTRAWNNAAVLAIAEKAWPQAAALVGQLLRQAPGDSRSHYYAAQVAEAQGDWAKAAAAIREALRLRPGEPTYLEFARRLPPPAQP